MLILTSSSHYVTEHFVRYLDHKPSELKLTFISSAAEVEKGDMQWLRDDREALVQAGFQVSDFTVTGKKPTEVEEILRQSDAVFVSGGNVFFLLQEMKKSGFFELIAQYVQQGLTYIGSSAGSVVAGANIQIAQGLDDKSVAKELDDYTGLGLVDTVVLPHWGSSYFKEKYVTLSPEIYDLRQKIILLSDEQYLLVKDGVYTIESI